jgi:pimeloyl-ACP methyl ester carboxylesterase
LTKILKHKVFKRVLILFIVLSVFSQLTFSCLQFRMSSSEIEDYFKEEEIKPKLKKNIYGNRIINYAIVESGDKPLVIFLHGAPGSLSAFIDYLKNRELQQSVNMISVDRPGYGYSNFGKEETSLQAQAFYIAELIKEYKKGNPVILVGHSLGGPIAAKVVMQYPGLVQGLIIVAGSIDPEQEKEEWYRPLGRGLVGKIFLPNSFWVTNEEIYHLKNELEMIFPYWKDIQIPVTVIHGLDDNLVPKENAEFAQKMISPEYLDVWLEEGVNHFIPWNRSDLINSAIQLHTSQ